MKKLILGLAAAAATFAAGAAAAQPHGGYQRSYYDGRGGYDRDYRYDHGRFRDRDRDGIPDRAEWSRHRNRDGRLDQYGRHDNRRDRHWRDHRGYGGHGYRW